MNYTYKVPIIPQNLNKQETIIQIGEVIDHLLNVTDDLCEHINNRIDSSNSKLSNLSERIDKVNSKINKLSGAKKATQVFSSCKYPAANVNQPYKSIFSNVKPVELVRHKVKHKRLAVIEEPLDKLYVYHVKVKANEKSKQISGLGEIPNDIECINDLLLYNTGKNLYKKFELTDALENTQQVREQEANDSSNIGAAPHSICERSTLIRSVTTNYFYSPNLGEVPSLDVPLDLPDLPGIAGDLRYDTELDPGIAPSVVTPSNIPDLPLLQPERVEETSIVLPPPPSPPPPPPPPPPPVVVELLVEAPQIKLPEPPPPPPPVPEISEDVKREEIHQTISSPSSTDGRANLMEAIRQAGGSKKLKSAKINDKPNVAVGGGNDLMADLHAKLSMRRKGISGTRKTEGMDAGTALEKISAMIPPPIRSEINDSNSNVEDEDWDD